MYIVNHLAATALLATTAFAAFKEGCSSAPWDSQEDFFLNKFDNSDGSLPFVPLYNNTYVAIKNMQRRYVVLHCSDKAPPRSVVGDDAVIVKVPVQSVGVYDGFSQNLIDMLGMSETIKRTGDYADVTSACIRGNMRSNLTYDRANWADAEAVNVTFHGDAATEDLSTVLIYGNGRYSPLVSLAYIKFFSIFYGIEEVAEEVFNNIATNYRCAAARVQDMVMNNDYPTGAWVSAFESNGKDLTVFQNDWWSTIASDAGSKLVNVSSDAKDNSDDYTSPGHFSLAADKQNVLTKESWALIDTSQYNQYDTSDFIANGADTPRIDASSYGGSSGMSADIYAVKEKNVLLADKAQNKNLRHNFFDRGLARPDLVLRDLISFIKPSFDSGYTTAFMRTLNKPDDVDEQRSFQDRCVEKGKASEALKLAQCELPAWAGGYHSSGMGPNAYHRDGEVKSLAQGGKGGNGGNSGLSGGAKGGIAAGAIIGGLLIIGGIAFVLKRKRSPKASTQQMEEGKLSPASSISHQPKN